MAFDAANFGCIVNPVSVDSSSVGMYVYSETATALATIIADNYLNDVGQIDTTSAATEESTKNRTAQLHVGSLVLFIGASGAAALLTCTNDGSSGNVEFNVDTTVAAAV